MVESKSAVWTAMAASHADASAFFTPNDDNGSTNDAASPTSNAPSAAVSAAPYGDESEPHGASANVAPSTSDLIIRVRANSRRYPSGSWPRAGSSLTVGSSMTVT